MFKIRHLFAVVLVAISVDGTLNNECCEQHSEIIGIPIREKYLPMKNQNPFDSTIVRRARAHVGDTSQWRQILCDAVDGKKMHIAVVGGSVTYGTHCEDPHNKASKIDCAWPARFEKWLNEAFPLGAPHIVENLSEGGSSSLVATEILALRRNTLLAVDLIIIDYAVNDASNVQIQPKYRKRTEHAEEVDGLSCSSLTGEYRDRLMISTEKLIKWCRALPSNPAILIMDTFNPRADWHKQAQDAHMAVASYYQLPVISYRDAVWHTWRMLLNAEKTALTNQSAPTALCSALGFEPRCSDALWTFQKLHPPWNVHQLMADLVALSFKDEYGHMCHNRIEHINSKDNFVSMSALKPSVLSPLFGHISSSMICDVPISVMSTLPSSHDSISPITHQGWSLLEDVQGKPGWVSTTDGAEIVFELSFLQGDVNIGFLRSYSQISKAHVSFSENHPSNNQVNGKLSSNGAKSQSEPFVLDGQWDDLKSELVQQSIKGVGQGRIFIHIKAVAAGEVCKFKLILLMSC